MFHKQTLLGLVGGVILISLPAFSQEEGLNRNEFTVQALGSFVKSTTNNGVDQSATNSGGVLGTYRFLFNRYNGVEANYGYSLNTQTYGLSSGSIGVKSYSHEASAAYVFRYPLKHWTPFVLAGAGALVFDPDTAGIGSQTRASFVYGGGADFSLSKHVYIRAEYRGFVYNSPTYDISGLAGTNRITHRAEPSIGFGYRF
ncbi:MAG: outer membrane beta-barrel protein [Bryobacteraceae bacterium]|jgi:opacity protein-like surface antigen